MKKIVIAYLTVVIICTLWTIWLCNPIEFRGNIYHARYGKYPKVVSFQSGMSIMPMQTAILGQPTNIVKNEDGTTTVSWE